jgi:hypothetical protein
MTRKGAIPLSVDLERYLASLALPEVSLLVKLHKAWPGIAGPLLAGKAIPARFRNGVLTIVVRSHAWAQELQMCKPVLLSKIVPAIGPGCPVSDLRFVVGTIPRTEEDREASREGESAFRATEPEGLSEVADPEMKESLRVIIRGMRIKGKTGGPGS